MAHQIDESECRLIKGFVSPIHTSIDGSNIANQNNSHIFTQVINGDSFSAAYDYLLNMGFTRLNDAKSIVMFNEGNIAATINSNKANEEIIDKKTIFLSQTDKKISKSVVDVFEQRHSTRSFSPFRMSFEEFSMLMKLSFGLAKRKLLFDDVMVHTRHYGSGGGFYPVQVILLINNISKISPGVYKYQPHTHSIYPLNADIKAERLFEHGSFDFNNYSFAVLYKYDLNRNYIKYGELSLAITFIEVGLMSQMLGLACAALDYTGCQIAGYDKHYCEEQLDLDGINSHIVFSDLCGRE